MLVRLRDNVYLVRHARGERDIGDELFVLRHDPVALAYGHKHRAVPVVYLVIVVEELVNMPAPYAALAVRVMLLGVIELDLQRVGDDRGGDYLRVRVRKRRAGRFAVVF